jgi:hypothetical protein
MHTGFLQWMQHYDATWEDLMPLQSRHLWAAPTAHGMTSLDLKADSLLIDLV